MGGADDHIQLMKVNRVVDFLPVKSRVKVHVLDSKFRWDGISIPTAPKEGGRSVIVRTMDWM
jgi:hypothetical protein